MSKIAVVIPKYGLAGGAEQFASELTGKLRDRTQDDFHVLANRIAPDPGAVRFEKIPVVSFPKWMTTVSFAWFVQNQIRRGNFDLVHSHERIFAADIFTLHGVPHRYWVDQVRRKSMSLYDRATAWVERKLVLEGGCRKFVAVSSLTRDIFLREYPIDPEKVSIIHPGVELSGYRRKNKNEARHAVRSSLGIGENDPVIVFASMNFEIKGLDDIIASLGNLQKQAGSLKLVVAGKGNARKYQKMAGEAGVAENIVFTGVLDREKLMDLYLAGDLYVMLSQFDTFGMVVLEAMAAGLPVMVSSRVGAKDVVVQGENGFVIENPSDHDYVASVLKTMLDEGNRRRMSAAALATASENSWDAAAEKYRALYEEILAAKKKEA
ncbi:MAG: glycosyltransferase family 4 protein [Smithellaceae bacterium]|nr:glycosyltransferase family 4 protein [Smithellaceae bacterium]